MTVKDGLSNDEMWLVFGGWVGIMLFGSNDVNVWEAMGASFMLIATLVVSITISLTFFEGAVRLLTGRGSVVYNDIRGEESDNE